MKITSQPLTISLLFSGNNEQFWVPAYQRRYSWEWKHIAELYDDIDQLKENDTHFLGSIVCLTSSHKAGINLLELVDGQQRITSLSIFLQAIKDRCIKLEYEDISDEIDSYIFCKGIDRKPENKVLLGDLDNPDYEKMMVQKDLDKVKNKYLLDAYNNIKERLDKLELDELKALYFKFINNVTVIRLDVSEAKDAYKLFETINNRGLSLYPTDIIKNFVLGHASTINKDTLTNVQENWKGLIVNLDGINTDAFFRQYMCGILSKKVTFTYLIDGFKKYYLKTVKEARSLSEYEIYNKIEIEDENKIEDELPEKELDNENGEKEKPTRKQSILDFSKSLNKASKIYSKLLNRKFKNNKINGRLLNLQRIQSFPTYTFLLNIFQREELSDNVKIELLKILETFMLRFHICEKRTGELDDIFSKLVKVESADIVNKVKNELLRDFPHDKVFKEKFAIASFKGKENRAKYILETVEYYIINDAGEYTINSGNDVHLEHIIPQTIDTKKSKREFGDWITYLGKNALENHKECLNRIGNLTLLGQKLNIIASNNPFEAKKNEYKKSNIRLTKKIVRKFKDFRYTEVESRSMDLAKYATKLWNFN